MRWFISCSIVFFGDKNESFLLQCISSSMLHVSSSMHTHGGKLLPKSLEIIGTMQWISIVIMKYPSLAVLVYWCSVPSLLY